MNFIPMQAGYPPAIIRQAMRLDYYLALEQADLGNPDNFSELIVEEVQQCLETMEAILVR